MYSARSAPKFLNLVMRTKPTTRRGQLRKFYRVQDKKKKLRSWIHDQGEVKGGHGKQR